MSALSFAQIPPQPLHWLWPDYIPLGRLTLLAADPGTGKTALALHLASQLSRGEPLPHLTPRDTRGACATPTPEQTAPPAQTPDQKESPAIRSLDPSPIENRNSKIENPRTTLAPDPSPLAPSPRSTLLLSPEDHPADTLLPRLLKFNANLSHIHILPITPGTSNRGADKQSLADLLRNTLPDIRTKNLRLIIIDPITAFLPLSTSTAPLYELADLAHEHNLAILLTTRLTKFLPITQSQRALRSVLGALSFSSACRAVHLLLQDPKVPARRLFIPIKTNVGPLPQPLAFSLTDTLTFEPTSLDPADLPAHDPILQHAAKFLESTLAAGPVRASDMIDGAAKSAISRPTLLRAKTLLNIQSSRRTFLGQWFWHLPNDTREPTPTMEMPFANIAEMLTTIAK